MIWLALIVGQIFLGFEYAFFTFAPKFDTITLIVLGIPIGISFSSLTFYLVSFFLRFNSFHLLIHTVCIFVAGYTFEFIRWRKKIRLFQKPERSTIFFVTASLLLTFLVVPNMYFPKPGFAHSTFTGDIPEEISLMNSFYQGANSGFMNIFKIRHPVCYKCHVRSRWLTALHSAMFLLGYSSTRQALIVPSMVMFFSICYLMMKFSNYFLKNIFLSLLALIVFLFAGGFGFTFWLESNSRNNRSLDFVFNFGPIQTEWSHPLFHYIFALRPSQLSLALIISVFLILTLENPNLGKWEMVYLGMLVGFLPAIQHQSFIGSILFLSVYWTFTFPYQEKGELKEKLKYHFFFAISFIATSIFPLIHFLPRDNRFPMFEKEKFWQALVNKGRYFAPIQVWYEALGLFPLFTLVISWFVISKKLKKLYIPSVFVFLVANHYRYQSYVRQNITVFYPFWMVIASIVFIYTMARLSKLPAKSEEAQGVIIGLCGFVFLCTIWSAVLGFYRLRNGSTEVFTSENMIVAKWIAENTPKKAVFISSEEEFDTVAVLAGKVSYLHSSRLMWLNGFDGSQKDSDISNFLDNFNDGNYPKIMLKKVKYVVNYENRKNIRKLVHWGAGNWTKIYSRGNYSIFERNLV